MGFRSLWWILAAAAAAAPASAATTIHLCGDSTMAKGGGGASGKPTEGWGEYLKYSFGSDYVVRNAAIGGRSARSYTREGRFQAVADIVKPGDWVVIEFGHNDGGSLSTDNGRTDCPGDGAQTCQTTYNGVAETVLTYPAYYKNAANLFLGKGAKVILNSPTPNNICESGTCVDDVSRFDTYAKQAAIDLASPNVYHVPHKQYAVQVMKNLGPTTVTANYPNDHTHTGPFMANVMAGSFVLGLKCGTSALGKAVKNSTESLASASYGACIK
ncbi:carbohydrate esterase family 12 protein [Annulohypoxylon maeteangense]|uniref:carbohydrate esterase family 12 protein n=1 Tax=Annulohypoxylon maeteangense TaxID=1927788 RepID=UPI0020077AD3|nr:carbohydrate esterase family 12 protein [Annulohypoxylon maeteangense]KAI0880900.1 carbohydrate esterase family 12 protein [Annulohypoxylon maeteangense]